jgi:ATP-dependent Lon protease
VKQKVSKKSEGKTRITPRGLQKYLGVKRFRFGRKEDLDRIGQVTGLAWTEVGGDLLTIEAAVMPGKGRPSYTGQLGDIMQESIQAAMTVVRSRVDALGIDPKFYQKTDVHIHVPEGATPKDGPSAGVGMCTALVSALTRIPCRSNVAMTGEITLRGEVLPIGGLKEKLLAALRGGIDTVLIPDENERELTEIPANIMQNLDVKPVKWIDEVFEVALQHMPNLTPDQKNASEVVEGETPAGDDEGRKPLRTH